MSGKKRKPFEDSLVKFEEKLKKVDEHVEAAFGRFEQRLDGAAKSAENSLQRLDYNIEEKSEKLDQWFQQTEKKLDVILETDGLKKYFEIRRSHGVKERNAVKAVDGVDLDIVRGETLGIVGESGCGKSTIARIMIGLVPPSAGHVHLFGKDLAACTNAERRAIRRRTGIVFQDPYGSLDPRMTVADIVSEPLRAYKLCKTKTDRLLKTLTILVACGMNADDMFKFPHQFSGGQRQRICIARALVANPDIVVCDEAVSSLDVSIQAQIVNLLCDLRDELKLTYIFISHDLDVVRFIADRVAVMYMGKVVEIAAKDALFSQPSHPYTAALLESAPVFGRRIKDTADAVRQDEPFDGEEQQTAGCRYAARCLKVLPECSLAEPPLRMISAGHAVACHRYASEKEDFKNE